MALKQQITALRVHGIHGDFIPEKLLRDLISKPAILEELRRNDYAPEILSESSEEIAKYGQKMFAILVETGSVKYVAEFLSGNLLDGKLPLQERDLEYIGDTSFVVMFLRFQWDYLAPLWRGGSSSHKILATRTILPFIQEEFLSEGSFGKTFMVTFKAIHQGFVQCPDGDDVRLLRKELINNWSDAAESGNIRSIGIKKMLQDFKNETRILNLLRHTKNPRIVKILGSYVYKGVYNLLFPLADMDLESFLQGDPSSWTFSHSDEIFEELRGLAAALTDVHSYRCQEMQLELIGCHHDLKPSNILLFGGRLTLADFGVSRLVPPKEGSSTYFKDCLGDYFSPESLNEKLSQQMIGRASDIWSLGCVIIEVITFSELGAKGVRQFRSARRTEGRPRYINSWFHSGGKMKIEVENWLSKLRENTQDDNVKRLVTLARSMLSGDPAHRPSSHTVLLELTRIALMSLSERVAKQFQAFLEGHDDFHLRLEKKRFDEWCDGVGIMPTKSRKSNSCIEVLGQFCSEVRQHMLAMCELIPIIPHEEGIPMEYENTEDPEDLYVSVRDHNDFLWKILPLETRRDIQFRWRRQRLETSGLDELKAMEQSADREVACLATMKRLFLLMDETNHSGGTEPITPDDINVEAEFGEHSLGTYTRRRSDESVEDAEDGKRVIIEWWDVKDWDPPALEELYIRMSMIASLPNAPDRPPEFCVLNCEGYYYDRNKHRFGIVYATPMPTTSRSLPITLRDFIGQNKSVSEGRRPLLGDRFALALSISLCVTEFHAVGWLHHDLCADNIIFFSSTATTNGIITIQDPYIIGFNHSRPDEDGNLTLERSCAHWRRVYQHPDYKVSGGHHRFHRAFDYYSLGVVLLEIGLWYTMQNFDDEFETLKLAANRDLLVEYARQLGAYMGELYRDAVMYCLTAEYDEGLDVEEKFQQKVLGPLSRCTL